MRIKMTLTRDVGETVAQRVQEEDGFAHALLAEAATLFLNGESDTARLILRDLVKAIIGFETLAGQMSIPSKNLRRMLSERGNPSMNNIAVIFGALSKSLNVHIETNIVKAKKKRALA